MLKLPNTIVLMPGGSLRRTRDYCHINTDNIETVKQVAVNVKHDGGFTEEVVATEIQTKSGVAVLTDLDIDYVLEMIEKDK